MKYLQNELDEMNKLDSLLMPAAELISLQVEIAERKFADKFKSLLLENIKINQVDNLLHYSDETNSILAEGLKGDLNVTLITDIENINRILSTRYVDAGELPEHIFTPLLLNIDIGKTSLYHMFRIVDKNSLNTTGMEFCNNSYMMLGYDGALVAFDHPKHLIWLNKILTEELIIGKCMFNELRLISTLKPELLLRYKEHSR